MADVYYFVSYTYYLIDGSNIGSISNVILKNIHPLVWAASPPEHFAKHFSLYLNFYTEIPEDIALNDNVQGYFSVSTQPTPTKLP